MPSRPRLRAIALPALLSLTPALASAEPETAGPSTQLEAGKNVKVIDMGATGLNDLSEAVKRLNAPREAAAAATPPAETEAAVPAEGEAPASAPPASVEAGAAPTAPAAGEHPPWLVGRWAVATQCPPPKANAGRVIEITPTQARFDQQRCDIQVVSMPKPEVAAVIYRCQLNGKSTQESHVFQTQSADKLLLDNVQDILRCP